MAEWTIYCLKNSAFKKKGKKMKELIVKTNWINFGRINCSSAIAPPFLLRFLVPETLSSSVLQVDVSTFTPRSPRTFLKVRKAFALLICGWLRDYKEIPFSYIGKTIKLVKSHLFVLTSTRGVKINTGCWGSTTSTSTSPEPSPSSITWKCKAGPLLG